MDENDIRALLGDTRDVYARLDASGRILRCVAGARYVGRPAEELIGHLLDELLPPGGAALVRAGLERAQATGEVQVVEHGRPSPMGVRSVRARVTPASNGELIAHVLDVTDEAQTRCALAESLESQRLFAQAATDAHFDHDVAGNRTRWTDGIASALGYPSGFISDVDWWNDRIHPDERVFVRAEARAAMEDRSRALWTGEYRFRAADGRFVNVYNRSLFVRDGDGKVTRVVGSMIDVTEKKRLERRLRMADRLSSMGTFAAGLAHEVRNPLAVALGNLALARRALAAQRDHRLAPVAALLVDAEEGARRVGAVVDGLGKFNQRSDGGDGVDVRSVVERALVVAGHDLTRRARVDLELADVPFIAGDTQQLGQVVLNLLANAQQSLAGAPDDEAHLRISLWAQAQHVVLEVEDTGEGILPEHLPRLFEPFFTTKPDGVGTGLGLAICREIVAAHGGTIVAEAVQPHGAMFRVTLPVALPS